MKLAVIIPTYNKKDNSKMVMYKETIANMEPMFLA